MDIMALWARRLACEAASSLRIQGHADAAAVMTCREWKAFVFNFTVIFLQHACLVAGTSIVIDEQVTPASIVERLNCFLICREISVALN